jgi:putative ABC transport system ATP-binding protein
MERSLFSFVWKYSRSEQLILLVLTVLTFPILYATLELPKIIINDAIGAETRMVDVFGFEITQTGYLFLLCFAFLLTVIAWGLVKMRLNTMKGIMAERLLRRFRYQLITRVLRFPLPHFRRTSQGEMVSIVTSEAEPLGGLMGDAIAQPVFQGGQMLTILGFLFVQNFWLGLTAIALIPLQAWIIPKLQRQVNLLNIERVQEVRRFSERIGETVAGVEDIRANGVAPYTLAQFTHGLGRLFSIRHRIYEKKYFMKFVNNLISQMTPFFFFAIGGYLVIQENLTVGALVAALAAYKDLSSPWKELLAYYNQTQDMSLRYETIIEQFDPPGLLDAKLIEGRPDSYPHLDGPIVFENVTVREPDGGTILNDLSLTIPAGSTVALQVSNASERRALSQILSRSILPTSGRVTIGGHDLNTVHQGVVAARIGVAGSKPYLFKGRIEDNTRLALRTLPCLAAADSEETRAALAEAARTGNSEEAGDVPWLELGNGGFKNETELFDWWDKITQTLGTDGFLFKRGLDVTFNPADHKDLAASLVALRPEAQRRMVAAGLCSAVHVFNPEKFNPGQAVGGNILYAASKQKLKPQVLAHDPEFNTFLADAGLTDEALELGAELLAAIAFTFGDVGGKHPLFLRLGLETDLFEWLNRINDRRATGGIASLCALDSQLLSALPFCFTAEQFGSSFSDDLKEKILEIRRTRTIGLGPWGQRMFSPIDANEFIEGITVLENLAFGKLAMAGGKAIDDLHELLGALLEEKGLRAKVAGLIGDIHLTAGGTNISPTTHERIAFIRAAMRRPDILVLDQALQTHHHSERLDLRERTRALLPDATIIHLEPKVERQDDFDEVFEIADGQLVSDIMPESDDADGQNDLARKIRAFGRTSLFDGLSRSQLRLLAFASQWFETKAGDYIFREGEDADAAYLIADGMGELGWADSGEIDFEERFVKPGRLIGDLSVIQGDRRSIDLIAREDVRGLRIGATEFLEVIGSDPEIALSLLRTVSGYLIGTAEQLRKLKRKA